MLKTFLFPFVLAVFGAVFLGSFGVMKNSRPDSKFGKVLFSTLVVLGILAEIYGVVVLDQGSRHVATGIFLLIFGLGLEMIAAFVAAVLLFFHLTPVVASEMDRLAVTPEQRTKIRKTVWKHFRWFQRV